MTPSIVAAVHLALALTLATASLALGALGDGAGPTWRWRAPPGCPDAQTTGRALAAAVPPGCAIRAEAEVRASPGEWRLELRLQATGAEATTRTLTATTCDALADAAIVIVTVACVEDAGPEPAGIRPTARLAGLVEVAPAPTPAPPETDARAEPPPSEPPPSESPPSATPPSATPPSESPPSATPPSESKKDPIKTPPEAAEADRRPTPPPATWLGLRGGLAWLPTRAVAGAGGPLLRVAWRWLALELSAGYTTARITRDPARPELGVAQRLVHGGLGVCPQWRWRGGRGRAALCLHGEGGVVLGTGVGALNNFTRARPWAALGLAPGLGWSPRPRISLDLGVDLLVSLSRPVFAIAGADPITEVVPFCVRLHTAIIFRLI